MFASQFITVCFFLPSNILFWTQLQKLNLEVDIDVSYISDQMNWRSVIVSLYLNKQVLIKCGLITGMIPANQKFLTFPSILQEKIVPHTIETNYLEVCQ